MGLRDNLRYAGLTDPGRVRDHNEDAIVFDEQLGLVVVADGMGGYNAGEVASGIAIKSIVEVVREGLDNARHAPEDPETGLIAGTLLLRDAIRRANHIIFHASQTQPQCAGMGTTVVACLFHEDRVSVAHVGDSRLYRLRSGQFEQVTTDHSLLAELVARGFYTPEEARQSLNKNLVTRALGIEKMVEVALAEEPVLGGDTFLLCSDGLSDMVEDSDIGLTISNFGANLQAAAEQLVQRANDNGGRDNISA
ncbi:MAG: Stp1/IreP family PP2C-type Ser/Thr phosphatase, partial [Gammaproteobacteria bacterium]